MKPIPAERRKRILNDYNNGMTEAAAEKWKVAPSFITKLKRRVRETGNIEPIKPKTRPTPYTNVRNALVCGSWKRTAVGVLTTRPQRMASSDCEMPDCRVSSSVRRCFILSLSHLPSQRRRSERLTRFSAERSFGLARCYGSASVSGDGGRCRGYDWALIAPPSLFDGSR